MNTRLLPLLLSLAVVSPLFAHPGKLDANGGHNDRKNGGYHYHRTPAAPASAPAPKPAPQPASAPAPEKVAIKPAELPPVEKVEYHAPAKPTAATAAATASLLFKVAIGMTKAEVETQIGKPNIASSTSWHYSGHGWVRFKDEKVSSVEAR